MKISISTTITNHKSAQAYILEMPDPNDMSVEEVIERIIKLNEGLKNFWGSAEGWAPIEAAKLLLEAVSNGNIRRLLDFARSILSSR